MGSFKKLLSWSNLAIIIVLFLIGGQNYTMKLYKNEGRVIASDVINYYAYIPTMLIYNAPDFKFKPQDFEKIKRYVWPHPVGNGNSIVYTTMGMSLAYLPFIAAVHFPLKWMGLPATGFTPPYRIALILACLAYLLLALILLKKVLSKYFNDITSAITILLLALGTNLLYYSIDEPAMTHAFNFSFGVFFLYLTMKWHEKPSVLRSVLTGLVIGMIALIRIPDAIIAIVFVFWEVHSVSSFKEKIVKFWKYKFLILLIILSALLIWIPQLIYWKTFTGQFFYNSYSDDGSQFFFTNPPILQSFFSYRKGWFLYTPAMLLLFPGIYFLWKKQRHLFLPVVLYFILNTWIVASWYIYWYGGSYGLRAYIASYSIISLLIASVIYSLLESKKFVLKALAFLIPLVFILHNLFQLQQNRKGAIHYFSMTKEAYWDSFGRKTPSPRFYYLLSPPNYDSARAGVYPKSVVDPLYTGELDYENALKRFTLQYYQKLDKDQNLMISDLKEARQKNISYNEHIKTKARVRFSEMVRNKIILLRENSK